jgi:hypothetical protein
MVSPGYGIHALNKMWPLPGHQWNDSTNLKVGETVYLKAWVAPKYQLWNVGVIPGTLEPNEANISLEWLKTNALQH